MPNVGAIQNRPDFEQATDAHVEKRKKNFGSVMSSVADGALDAVASVGSVVPGGGIVAAAARGVKALKLQAEGKEAQADMDRMWEMQRENQKFNLQYLELQTTIQNENRRFTTVSNLMKARHDTAKAAINNMNV